MQLPQPLLDSLEGLDDFDLPAFWNVHENGEQLTSIRLNPLKPPVTPDRFGAIRPVPWAGNGYYLDKRPSFTFDPLFHAGTYYVQEASSMFLEQAMKQLSDLSAPLKVLDLSAAPGGKSTHLQSLISPESLLVSNEVIRPRANILKDNIIKWGGGNVVVTHNDPSDFFRFENYFDVIVVDAPCSGSGLFRRDPNAINEWSPQNVSMCAQRQQRILTDIYPALKQGGRLIYSTCSYSKQEDEDILDWFVKGFELKSERIQCQEEWGVTEIRTGGDAWGYRFWPYQAEGEGFFIAAFTKTTGSDEPFAKTRKKPAGLTATETERVSRWIDMQDYELIRHEQTIYAWPLALANDINFVLNNLRVIYSGILLGELKHDKLVTDHALAMSTLVKNDIARVDLGMEDAIRFLQRKDLSLITEVRGWALMGFEGHSLGWANILSNRINNYYPKELRILKEKQ